MILGTLNVCRASLVGLSSALLAPIPNDRELLSFKTPSLVTGYERHLLIRFPLTGARSLPLKVLLDRVCWLHVIMFATFVESLVSRYRCFSLVRDGLLVSVLYEL